MEHIQRPYEVVTDVLSRVSMRREEEEEWGAVKSPLSRHFRRSYI